MPEKKQKVFIFPCWCTVTLTIFGESVMWRRRHYLFEVTGSRGGIIEGGGQSLFFYPSIFRVYLKRRQDEGLTRNSNARTEGTDPGAGIGAWSGRTWWVKGYIQLFFYWPVATERGQGEGSTLKGILGEGRSTWSTGCFTCDIIWRLQQPHRAGGRKHATTSFSGGPWWCH